MLLLDGCTDKTVAQVVSVTHSVTLLDAAGGLQLHRDIAQLQQQ
jgi:hypothetical protein